MSLGRGARRGTRGRGEEIAVFLLPIPKSVTRASITRAVEDGAHAEKWVYTHTRGDFPLPFGLANLRRTRQGQDPVLGGKGEREKRTAVSQEDVVCLARPRGALQGVG